MLTVVKWIVILAAAGYVALLLVMYLAQRSLMYFPDPTHRTPASAALPQAEEVMLTTSDGERLLAWYAAPQAEKPLVIYFQGNGGGLDLRANRFGKLVSDGTGLLAVNYRGYGGSTGRPTEAGLIADANAAYDYAAARVTPARIMLWGESLGTGVAVALASQRPVGRVLLESPYTSIADVAASIYWFVPVRLLIKDTFGSEARIGNVTAPVLILHGERDTVVPIKYGERLYAAIRAPKKFVRLPGSGHNDHDEHGGVPVWRGFFAGGPLN